MPKNVTTKDLNLIKAKVIEDGFLMSTGLPPINKILESKGRGILVRIPHMGDITKDMLDAYLSVLRKHLLS